MSGKVVHFEIPFDEEERAIAFYRTVFGWEIVSWEGEGYHLVSTGPGGDTGPTEPGYIGGGMLHRQDPIHSPVITIDVDDIAAALAAVETSGGTTVQAGQPVGDMGFAAYCTDSEGNLIGLWQSAGVS